MGYYTRNGGLIGTGTNSQLTGVSDIIAAQLSANGLSDLREFMDDVGTAIQNGRTGYLLSTNNYSYRFDAGDARYINDGGGETDVKVVDVEIDVNPKWDSVAEDKDIHENKRTER